MRITMRSMLTGAINTMDIPSLEQEHYEAWLNQPPRRQQHIQDAFPHLTPDEREFLITGTTPEEFKDVFGEPQE